MVPSALVRNALYSLIDATNSIVQYDLAERSVSVLHLPPDFDSNSAVLTTEDGVLGVARVENSRLRLWSMETGLEGDAVGTPKQSIDLVTLLQLDADAIVNDRCFRLAQGIGVIFVGTEDDAWFRIGLESEEVREEDRGDGHTVDVIPYTSFYVPGTTLLIVHGFSISRT